MSQGLITFDASALQTQILQITSNISNIRKVNDETKTALAKNVKEIEVTRQLTIDKAYAAKKDLDKVTSKIEAAK